MKHCMKGLIFLRAQKSVRRELRPRIGSWSGKGTDSGCRRGPIEYVA